MTQEERQAVYQESLSRAVQGDALSNYPAIYAGFTERGIPEDQIRPRENVFTFNAWKAQGRFVRKGERGVKVVTYIPMEFKERDKETGEEKAVTVRKARTAYVFHVSQTEPVMVRV